MNSGLPSKRQTPTLLFTGQGEYQCVAVTDLSSNIYKPALENDAKQTASPDFRLQ